MSRRDSRSLSSALISGFVLFRGAGLLDDDLVSAVSPVLLHGEDAAAWPVLKLAASRRLDTRIGLEDVLHRPDGTPAQSNADLVRAAREIIQRTPESAFDQVVMCSARGS